MGEYQKIGGTKLAECKNDVEMWPVGGPINGSRDDIKRHLLQKHMLIVIRRLLPFFIVFWIEEKEWLPR